MNEIEISKDMMYVIKGLLAFGFATILAVTVRKAIRRIIDKRWEEGNEDVTRLKFLRNSIAAIFYTMALAYIFYEIPTLNNLGTAIFAGAGVLAAVIGFASQKAFSNIISGVFILLFRPFKVGDAVTVGTRSGLIEDITLRHTIIRDYEHRRVVIPNSVISDETIVNSDLKNSLIRQQVVFGVSYDSDVTAAIDIIKKEALDHPLSLDKRSDEEVESGVHPVVVRVLSWDDSAVSLRAQVWASNIDDGFVLKCDLLKSVKERFEKAGIEIPYPHRTLVMKNGVGTFSPAESN